ncbi:hypothetical protein T484DRAFT_1758038 [Baffinella frigidus]|nr:hypothetical protein T484DRAFT_1758038 [Cryptophyta sp. CCMP2293]
MVELYRSGKLFADVMLTWNSQGLDMVEAVAIDGVVADCSVDNSQWREKQGVNENVKFGTCDRSCFEIGWVGGDGRKCVLMTLPLGHVYDVLIAKLSVSSPIQAVRIRAPWVHTDGECRVSQGTSTVCGGPDTTWHGGLLSMGNAVQMGTEGTLITPLNSTMGSSGVSFATAKARPSTDTADLIFLSLDRGMRITRIVSATTVSDEAIKMIRKAKTREEVMIICRQYASSCFLTEHTQLPNSNEGSHPGWSFEQMQGSPVRANSGVPGSILWTADVDKKNCHISVGSWLIGSIPLGNGNGVGALFTRSVSQRCDAPQAVALVHPGFAWPKLIRANNQMEWSLTFIELQYIDELGVPVKRR